MQDHVKKLQLGKGLEVYPYINFRDKRVGIRIHNSTSQNSSGLKVRLKSLTVKPYTKNHPNWTMLPYTEEVDQYFHTTDGLNINGGIDKSDNVYVYLAEVRDNNLFFLLKKELQFHNYEEVIESAESVSKKREIEPAYTGYKNYMAYLEIQLSIRTEINTGQILESDFNGEINFIEMIRHWIGHGNKLIKVGDLPLVESQLDIVEVHNDQKTKDSQTKNAPEGA